MDSPASVFANPARAARAKHRFIYGTLRPNVSPEQPVSFAALFGSRERRWLFTVENGVRRQESTSIQTRLLTNPSAPDMVLDEQRSERELVATQTRARATLISRTDFGGVAFGLFGGYRNATRFDLSEFVSMQTGSGETSTTTRLIETSQDEVAVGAEVALAGRTWDLAASVSYQGRIADAERDFTDSFGDIENINSVDLEGSPAAVDVEVLGTVRMGRRRADYLFGSVDATFGGGSIESRLDLQQDMLDLTSETEADLSGQATRVSLGYVYAHEHRGLTVLAALNPSGSFARTESLREGLSTPTPSVAREETDVTTLALTLPLYVRFSVTKRLDAFGGGAYTYGYEHTESTLRSIPTTTLPEAPVVEQETERTSDALSSSSTLYAGAVMTFRSGLTAQAAFRGDLAALNRWTVSLGYRF